MTKKIPLRQCIGCGEQHDKRDMMRVVKAQDNTFCLDVSGKVNGRGAYLCKDKECLQKALKNKGLERAFKMSIPEDVIGLLTKEFEIAK